MMIKLQIELHPQKFQKKQTKPMIKKHPKDLAAASTFQGSSALGTNLPPCSHFWTTDPTSYLLREMMRVNFAQECRNEATEFIYR